MNKLNSAPRLWRVGPGALLQALACLTVQAEEAASLRFGAAAVDITPQQFPIDMPGGFSANMAEGAHDPLHARALVLDDGTATSATVVVDNLGLARETADDAKGACRLFR